MIWAFEIPGRPVTWKRTNDRNGRRITPAEMREAKEQIAWLALRSRPIDWPQDSPIVLLARFSLRTAQSEGDADNYGKLVQDALEGIAYPNDRQVKALFSVKSIGEINQRSEVLIAATDQETIARLWQATVDLLTAQEGAGTLGRSEGSRRRLAGDQ